MGLNKTRENIIRTVGNEEIIIIAKENKTLSVRSERGLETGLDLL